MKSQRCPRKPGEPSAAKPLSEFVRYLRVPVAGIEAMTANSARSFPRHTHDQYGIGVVDSGGHSSWSGCGQVEAGPGNFICVNPGEVHDGRAIGQQRRSWRILYFDPAVMREVRSDIFDGRDGCFTFVSPVFADEPMRRLFDTAFSYAAAIGRTDNAVACETAILTLIVRLSRHLATGPRIDRGPTACIRRVLNRIDADPAARLTLAELANEVSLSRYQLLRAFAHDLGLTPHAYIIQRRIEFARRLIRRGHELAAVAHAAGFCDQSHLTRCFVRQLGATPRRYASSTA